MEIYLPLQLKLFLNIFVAVSILVIMAIVIDLIDGIRTARITGERVHSHKLRVTINKIIGYWSLVVIGMILDCLLAMIDLFALPYCVVVTGACLVLVEGVSLIEHARRRKSDEAVAPVIIAKIISAMNKKDATEVIEMINDLHNQKGQSIQTRQNLTQHEND